MAALRFRRGKVWSRWYSAGPDPWQKAQAWARRHGTVELRSQVQLVEPDEW